MSGTGYDTLLDHFVREPILAVEFERASLYYHGSRMRPRFLALCDKPETNAAARKAKGQVEAGRASPDDQDWCILHGSMPKDFLMRSLRF